MFAIINETLIELQTNVNKCVALPKSENFFIVNSRNAIKTNLTFDNIIKSPMTSSIPVR